MAGPSETRSTTPFPRFATVRFVWRGFGLRDRARRGPGAGRLHHGLPRRQRWHCELARLDPRQSTVELGREGHQPLGVERYAEQVGDGEVGSIRLRRREAEGRSRKGEAGDGGSGGAEAAALARGEVRQPDPARAQLKGPVLAPHDEFVHDRIVCLGDDLRGRGRPVGPGVDRADKERTMSSLRASACALGAQATMASAAKQHRTGPGDMARSFCSQWSHLSRHCPDSRAIRPRSGTE